MLSWVRKVGDEAARREPVWQSRAGRVIGMVILLGILGGNLWLCWLAWKPTSEEMVAPPRERPGSGPARCPSAGTQPGPALVSLTIPFVLRHDRARTRSGRRRVLPIFQRPRTNPRW